MDDPAFGTAIILFIWLTCAVLFGKRDECKHREKR